MQVPGTQQGFNSQGITTMGFGQDPIGPDPGDGGYPTPTPPTIECETTIIKETDKTKALDAELAMNPGLLLKCDLVARFKALASFKAPTVVNQRIATLNMQTSSISPFFIQQLNEASGAQVNLDRFEVSVNTLPILNGTRLSASQFLNYIRINLNSFIDTDIATFKPYNDPGDVFNDAVKFNSSNPLGSLLHLDMLDDGSVIVTDNAADHWTVSTIRTPLDNMHPVSGNRSWGYTTVSGGFQFYVTGVDRLSGIDGRLAQWISGLPFDTADRLWTSFQTKLAAFINTHGGTARIDPNVIRERPDYNALKDYFDGKINLQQLKAKKGCQ